MTNEFWKGKRVLITGHTGFKGSWLSLWLQAKGAHVIGYSLSPPTEPSLFELASVKEGMVSIEGDIRDLNHLKKSIAKHQPEIVFHMAAQALVRYSYRDPVETYSTNVIGTVNLLEVVRLSNGIKAVVCITSDKCYENREWHWGYREIDPMGGHDPYSSSKGCAELVIAAYRNSYFSADEYESHGVAVASTRAGNVIGGGDWSEDRLIPDMIKAFLENRSVIIRSPNAIRPWQHVLEPLSGYLSLAEKLWLSGPEFAQGWNFGPNVEDSKPVSWIVGKMAELWNEGASWKLDSVQNPPEDNYLRLDSTKAITMLGWAPKIHLITALEWVCEWYRGYQQNMDLRLLSERQIERYENMGTE